MTTLYIDRKETELKIESKTIVCFISGERQRPIPLLLLDHVVVSSTVQFKSSVLLKLSEHGICVTFINPRNSKQQAMLAGPLGKNPNIRLAQYIAQQNQEASEAIAQQLIIAKVRNQRRLLEKYLITRDDLRFPLTQAVQQLAQSLKTLEQPVSVERLRGIEGSAARVSFIAYQAILPDALAFTGRKRRPPPDPVNACLSLAYTLLHVRATQQAYAQGFDPMLGFLHEPKYSRDSLAADLIEPWRPHVDEWVLELFTSRKLRQQDFTTDQGSCLLGKAGRQQFYSSYEPVLKVINRGMRLQLFKLKKALLSQQEEVLDETSVS
jgi:CRISPR-associated protein Cas1